MFIYINKYFQIFIIRNWLMTDAEPPVICSLQLINRRVGGIIPVQFQRPENQESKWSKFQSKSGFRSREDQCPSSKTVRQKEISFYLQAVSQPFCSSEALVVQMNPTLGAPLVAQLVKNPPVMWETWVLSLSWEDPLEKGKAIYSSILAWRIP